MFCLELDTRDWSSSDFSLCWVATRTSNLWLWNWASARSLFSWAFSARTFWRSLRSRSISFSRLQQRLLVIFLLSVALLRLPSSFSDCSLRACFSWTNSTSCDSTFCLSFSCSWSCISTDWRWVVSLAFVISPSDTDFSSSTTLLCSCLLWESVWNWVWDKRRNLSSSNSFSLLTESLCCWISATFFSWAIFSISTSASCFSSCCILSRSFFSLSLECQKDWSKLFILSLSDLSCPSVSLQSCWLLSSFRCSCEISAPFVWCVLCNWTASALKISTSSSSCLFCNSNSWTWVPSLLCSISYPTWDWAYFFNFASLTCLTTFSSSSCCFNCWTSFPSSLSRFSSPWMAFFWRFVVTSALSRCLDTESKLICRDVSDERKLCKRASRDAFSSSICWIFFSRVVAEEIASSFDHSAAMSLFCNCRMASLIDSASSFILESFEGLFCRQRGSKARVPPRLDCRDKWGLAKLVPMPLSAKEVEKWPDESKLRSLTLSGEGFPVGSALAGEDKPGKGGDSSLSSTGVTPSVTSRTPRSLTYLAWRSLWRPPV